MAFLNADVLDRLCGQMHLLYKAGVPSEESLSLLAEDTPEKKLAEVYKSISDNLAKGDTFTEAVVRTEKFPKHFVTMLQIGEETGRMDQVFGLLSTYYRREADTQESLRRAVTYPSMMAVLIAVVFSILLVRVLPVFTSVFEQMGVSMPPFTKALLSAGNLSMYLAGIFCLIILVSAGILLIRVNRGSRLPIGRKASVALDQSRFSSAMSLMLKSALPIETALEHTKELLKGTRIGKKITICMDYMQKGVPFAKSLNDSGILGSLQAGILVAGSRAGSTDDAMEEVAERSSFEAEGAMQKFIGMFEFTLVVILCFSIGLVLLSVMLPLIGILASLG